jgi:hypothetical protein
MSDILGEHATVTDLLVTDDGSFVKFTATISPEAFAEFITSYHTVLHKYGLFLYVTKRTDPHTQRCKYCTSIDYDINRKCAVCNNEDSICFECELDESKEFYCSCFKEA